MTIRRQLLLAAFALVLLFTLGLVLIVDRFVVDALAGSVLDQTCLLYTSPSPRD